MKAMHTNFLWPCISRELKKIPWACDLPLDAIQRVVICLILMLKGKKKKKKEVQMKVKNRACEFNATFSGIISLVKGNKEGRKNRHYIKWASWKNVICSQIFIQRSPQTNSSLTKVSWNVGGIHLNNLKGNLIAQKNPRLRDIFPAL